MALVKCPECGKEVSSLASSCPVCGAPITALLEAASKPVQLYFYRPNKWKGAALWGLVSVDGATVGKAVNGATFSIMVAPGRHQIGINTIRDVNRVRSLEVASHSQAIDIPTNARKVSVEIIPVPSLVAILGNASFKFEFGNIQINHNHRLSRWYAQGL